MCRRHRVADGYSLGVLGLVPVPVDDAHVGPLSTTRASAEDRSARVRKVSTKDLSVHCVRGYFRTVHLEAVAVAPRPDHAPEVVGGEERIDQHLVISQGRDKPLCRRLSQGLTPHRVADGIGGQQRRTCVSDRRRRQPMPWCCKCVEEFGEVNGLGFIGFDEILGGGPRRSVYQCAETLSLSRRELDRQVSAAMVGSADGGSATRDGGQELEASGLGSLDRQPDLGTLVGEIRRRAERAGIRTRTKEARAQLSLEKCLVDH